MGVGRGYSRSTLFITQIFVYVECFGGREQRLMEMLALSKHPMSTTRLFLNERPPTTLQFPISPRIHKIPTPVKALRIPGVLQYTNKSTWPKPVRVKSHYYHNVKKESVKKDSVKKESDPWLHN